MQLPLSRELPYLDPVAALRRFAGLPGLVFLDSAQIGSRLGRYSYLMAEPFQTLVAEGTELRLIDAECESIEADLGDDPFEALEHQLAKHQLDHHAGLPPFQAGAAGYLSYDLVHHLERIPPPADPLREQPDLLLGFYDALLAWDHVARRCWIVAAGDPSLDERSRADVARRRIETLADRVAGVDETERAGETATEETGQPDGRLSDLPPITARSPDSSVLEGNLLIQPELDAATYQAAVAKVINYIHAGDIFQANISQRFDATLPEEDDPLSLYLRLRQRNPAPFAAYLDFDAVRSGSRIVSASPERFLRLRPGGEVETRPIKGTRPRDPDPARDAQLARELLASEKDWAENVMIVDLLRNDLSRVCLDGSVKTPQICELESFATVHHLVSSVEGRLRPGLGAVDLLRAAFPGGSITGAPKVRAMEIIAELEGRRRGPYCGSIAFLGFDGAMDSSITIRTILLDGRRASFRAGGGIVSDSEPEAEYQETLDKAAALIDALGGRLEIDPEAATPPG